MNLPLLEIRGLTVTLPNDGVSAQILRGVDLRIGEGKVVGLVGESGSGKSTLALALLGLLPMGATAAAEKIGFEGMEIASLEALGKRRGTDLAMVFQDPMTALNPMFTVGNQMVDIQRQKFPRVSSRELSARAEAMLTRVGVPDAKTRMRSYPHEYSGGMRQRVLIAMALLVEPRVLIADEPTTALDATIELQIVELLRALRAELQGSILIVSHSLGLIAELCDEVVVLYAGQVMEAGPLEAVIKSPRHPYTQALLACEIDPFQTFDATAPLVTIPGTVPNPSALVSGCAFASRCVQVQPACSAAPPKRLAAADHSYACWLETAA